MQQPISSPQPVATTNGEDGSVLNTVVDVAIGLTPFVGSGRDLYEGIKTGSVLLTAMGAGGLLLDFSTFGLASAFKGGIKATLLMFAKKGLENAAEAEAKNVVVDAVKGVTRSLDDLSSIKGATWDEAKSLIPKDWITGPMKKGEGIKFVNPAKKGEQILLEKGWPGAKDPLHAGPYMKISRNGQITRIPLQGNPTLK